jgi:hypothetical protein
MGAGSRGYVRLRSLCAFARWMDLAGNRFNKSYEEGYGLTGSKETRFVRRRVRLWLTTAVVGVFGLLVAAPLALAGAPTDATVVKQTEVVAAGHSAGLAMPCPAGQRVVGGGIDSYSPSEYMIASNPLDQFGETSGTDDGEVARYWYSATYNSSPDPQDAHFYVICSAASDATVQATAFSLDPNETSDVAVSCPTGQRAIGGGLGTTAVLANGAYTNPRLRASGPLDEAGAFAANGDVAHSWRAGADNITATQKNFVAFVVCSADSRAIVRTYDGPTSAVYCNQDELGLGGGTVPLEAANYYVTRSRPTGSGGITDGWSSIVERADGTSSNLRSAAVCEPPPQGTAPGGGGAAGAAVATGLRDAALKKCKKKHSRKARKKCRKKAARLPS